MHALQIRSRGQSALLAGIWLFLFVPFFSLGALGPSGYPNAAHDSFINRNYAPLLAWAQSNQLLVIGFTLVQLLPLLSILAIPLTVRLAVHGEEGRTARWLGSAGLIITIVVMGINLLVISAMSQGFTGSSHTNQINVGASYRIVAVTESLIISVLGGGLLSAWMWLVNFPLARIPGLERIIGFLGIASAALFGATAILVAYDPQQSHQSLSGATMAVFGIWLAMAGLLLSRRAPALGAEPAEV